MHTNEQFQHSQYGLMGPTFAPVCSLAENGTHYIALVDLPGVKKADLDVFVQGPMLMIRGIRHLESKTTQFQLTHNERPFGQFSREIFIPGYVDAEKVEAKLEDGQLCVMLPKKSTESAPFKSVDVANGSGKTQKN